MFLSRQLWVSVFKYETVWVSSFFAIISVSFHQKKTNNCVCVASTFASLFLNLLLSSNLSACYLACVFLPLSMFRPFTWFSRISRFGRMRWAAVSVHILHTSSVLSLSSNIVRFNNLLFLPSKYLRACFSSVYDPAVLCSIDSLSNDCKTAFSTPQSLTNIVIAVLCLPPC